MRARARLLASVALLGVLAAACGSTSRDLANEPNHGTAADGDPYAVVPVEQPSEPDLPVIVTSADGEEVTITDVDRILPLVGSLSELVFSLGLGDRVVGRDVAATFAQAEDLPVVTEGHEVSTEAVLSLRPSVVLADTWTGPPEAIEQLRRSGVPVVVVEEVWTLAGIAERIRAVATALGVPEAGEALVARTDADIDRAAELAPVASDPPRVAFLYLRGNAGIYLLGGPGSGADDLLARIGAEDAGTAIGLERAYTPITSEALIDAQPDVLLVMASGLASVDGVDGLVAIPGIAQTPAGRDRRVVAVDDDLLLSFGPRTGRVLELLARELYLEVRDD